MFKITLPADRAVTDMAAVANAFGINIKELHDGIETGTISRWFEVGEGDEDDKPHQIFASVGLGIRVAVDESGNVRSSEKYEKASPILHPNRSEGGTAASRQHAMEKALEPDAGNHPDPVGQADLDALLDEALKQSFPASDPIAISFDSPKRSSRSSVGPDIE